MDTKTVCKDVFLITEILENILLCVDIKSLLTSAQRVHRSWHDLITTSPALQKHLYMKPDWDKKSKTQNPLLAEKFPLWFLSEDTNSNQTDQGTCKYIQAGFREQPHFETLPLAQPDKNSHFMYEHASWRRMLVQQPPIPEYVVFKFSSGRVGTRFSGPWIQRKYQEQISIDDLCSEVKEGHRPLRMDAFYDRIVLMTGSMPRCWMIIWDNAHGDLEIPSDMESFKFDEEETDLIKRATKACGMVVVVSQVKQCCSPFMWTPGEKFVFEKARVMARGGKIIGVNREQKY